MSIILCGFSAVLLLRVLFFTVTGQNVYVEGVDEIAYGTADYIPWFGAYTAICLGLIFFAFGIERAKIGWEMGKGLVAPIVWFWDLFTAVFQVLQRLQVWAL